MGVIPPIDITAEQYKTILTLLRQYLPKTTAWVYGSRAKWTSKPNSDLDLVIFAEPEQRHQVGELREAFEESNLPFKVDLFVWDDVPDSFRKNIRDQHVELVSGCGETLDSITHDWPLVSVEAFSKKVAMGPFGSSIKVETFVPDGIPVISGQHLHGSRIDDTSGYNFITEKHAQRLANANVQRGDIFLHMLGISGRPRTYQRILNTNATLFLNGSSIYAATSEKQSRSLLHIISDHLSVSISCSLMLPKWVFHQSPSQ